MSYFVFKLNLFALLLFTLFSCNSNKFDVDISEIESNVKINRFEKDLNNIDLNNIAEEVNKLAPKYPMFLSKNLSVVTLNELIEFISGTKGLYDDIIKEYDDISFLEKDLSQVFAYIRYYYPDYIVPNVSTYNSRILYEEKIILKDHDLAIALDMYLGKDYYAKYGIANYQAYSLSKDYIVRDVVVKVIDTEIPVKGSKKNLLNNFIREGKKLYLLDAFMPFTHDSIKIRYTTKHLDWCDKNEAHMWKHFFDKQLFFSSKMEDIRHYIGEAPFTAPFQANSPPRAGAWIGWQIVKHYMDNNPEVTLQELVEEENLELILEKSGYNP